MCFWRRRGASHPAPFCGAARPAQLLVLRVGKLFPSVSHGIVPIYGNLFFSPANVAWRVSTAVQVLSRVKPSPAQLLPVLQTRCICSAGRWLPIMTGFCTASIGSLVVHGHLHTQPSQLHPLKKHFTVHFSLVSKLTCCSAQGFFRFF